MILQEQNSYEFHDILYARWDYIFPKKDLFPAGFEPATLCVWSTRDNRYTKETLVTATQVKISHPRSWQLCRKLGTLQIFTAHERALPGSLGFENPTCWKFSVGGTLLVVWNRGLFHWRLSSAQMAPLFPSSETVCFPKPLPVRFFTFLIGWCR